MRSLYFIAALLLVAIGVIASLRFSDPAVRYRIFNDEHALLPAIALHIDNGDSIDHVRQLLGPGAPGSHEKSQAWTEIQIQGRDKDSFAERYPDDIFLNDSFIAYAGFPNQFVIQFRNDRVVNLPKRWLARETGSEGG